MQRRWISAATAALLAGLAALPAQAQEKCSIGVMLTMPVTMVGRHPTVPVTINGHKMQLVADSGAFFSTLSPDTAAEYGLKLRAAPFGFSMMGIGGRADISIATVDDFGLVGHMLHHVEFIVGGSRIEQGGLLGQNVLGLADAEYDLANGAVRLVKPEHCDRRSNLAYWAKDRSVSEIDIQPARDAGMHTEGTVVLNGVKLRAMFDTGSPTSMLTRAAAARAGVKAGDAGVEEGGFSSGLGSNVAKTWIAAFDSLQIGDQETIKKIHLRFADIGDQDAFDMLIGADFFLSHRVYVSNAMHKMFLTYNGGPVFDLSIHHDAADKDAADGAAPTTAQAFSGRGTAFAARHEYKRAIADLDRAVALDPADPHYRFQRATIEMATEDNDAARRDLDGALKLAPDDVEALMARAWLRAGHDDKAGARQDADAVARIAAKPNDVHFQLALLYDSLEAPAEAIAHYGLWIDAHPHDSRLPDALNNRCWLRTLADRELGAALDDCNRALRLRPHVATMLDSRGLTRLRLGDARKAIDDYDDALRLDPKLAWSLYGRGLARHRLGMTAQGDADIAAAKAIQPDIAEKAGRHGVAQ